MERSPCLRPAVNLNILVALRPFLLRLAGGGEDYGGGGGHTVLGEEVLDLVEVALFELFPGIFGHVGEEEVAPGAAAAVLPPVVCVAEAHGDRLFAHFDVCEAGGFEEAF